MFYYTCLLILINLLVFLPCSAEITFDGSLGTRSALIGPDYVIEANRGTLGGNNLFHSFDQFNIDTGESATFTGPNQVTNIIGRVTGGTPSTIDGLLKSDIWGANLYLLNPSGINLGSNAHLDVTGSLHLSSADYLRFTDNQHFNTSLSVPSVLSVAPPAAFGFISSSIGDITINSKELRLSTGKNFSIVGGHIQLSGENTEEPNLLSVPGGDLQIMSANSRGEVMQSNVMHNTLTQFGTVEVTDQFIISTFSQSGGNLRIQSGNFAIKENALILGGGQTSSGHIEIAAAETLQLDHSNIQQILTTQGQGGDILLRGRQIEISNNSKVQNAVLAGQTGDTIITASDSVLISNNSVIGNGVDTLNTLLNNPNKTGQDSNVMLTTAQLQVENSVIASKTYSTEPSGNIIITTDRIELINGGRIGIETQGMGTGGTLNLQANESVTIRGYNSKLQPSGIVNQTQGQGDAGTLTLISPVLLLTENGVIGTVTSGTGTGGKIYIKTNELNIDSGRISSSSSNTGNAGEIQVEAIQLQVDAGQILAVTLKQGNAGNISLTTDHLLLTNGGQINASSKSTGTAGDIIINVAKTANIIGSTTEDDGHFNPSGISSSTNGNGQGGTIYITAPTLTLEQRSTIQTLTDGEGKAGNIAIKVTDLKITQGSDIDASNEGSNQDKGGNITINAKGLVLITAEAAEATQAEAKVVKKGFLGGIYSVALEQAGIGGDVHLSAGKLVLREGGVISVGSTGTGNAGDLTIKSRDTLELDNAAIITKATHAGGGNIVIETPAQLRVVNSEISAQAQGQKTQDRGGNVTIHNQDFFILNNSLILASAKRGQGGDIRINSNHLLQSQDSVLDASSELGIDGKIQIELTESQTNFNLEVLPSSFFKREELSFFNRCAVRSSQELSQFRKIGPRDIPLTTPTDLKTHYIYRPDAIKPFQAISSSDEPLF